MSLCIDKHNPTAVCKPFVIANIRLDLILLAKHHQPASIPQKPSRLARAVAQSCQSWSHALEGLRIAEMGAYLRRDISKATHPKHGWFDFQCCCYNVFVICWPIDCRFCQMSNP